ncbi:MAG: 23S rRNA (adenine(2503)-C(2))-methyltransferase RlmN [Candidatus Omnitrophica bacterium]|nr:23S rRNA (adenine(2503)-C(2))-methyltransferase RlmN [Candidatus Omnitrophota bacterium]
MQDIRELTLEELEKIMMRIGLPDFHARQIYAWIYQKGVSGFSQMTDLPLVLRRKLSEEFFFNQAKVIRTASSCDGTEKLLLRLEDNYVIEVVIIPASRRITGCVSTQVGCKFACSFCASGIQGFKRNLSCAEIVDEVLRIKGYLKNANLTHIVFMGTGEPLDNYDNLFKAVRIINSPAGLHIGTRRITISTAGFVPGIRKMAKEGMQVELSISLHAATDTLRSKLMPINKRYPLAELISVCKDYIRQTRRQITFEYILIAGVNSTLQEADNLARMLSGLRLCKVNLIPANAVRELGVYPPDKIEILSFRQALLRQGIHVTLRKSRGQDIEAACGQLRLRDEEK